MSFHTQVWVVPLDGEHLNFKAAVQSVTNYLDEHGLHHDTLKSLAEACASAHSSNEPTLFFLDSISISNIFRVVSQALPTSSFAVKGIGEEPRDVWVREFASGSLVFEAGPFDE
jgi:hypothetical protein